MCEVAKSAGIVKWYLCFNVLYHVAYKNIQLIYPVSAINLAGIGAGTEQ